MSPESLERVKEILDEALKLDAPRRLSYAREAANGDDEVYGEVASLLEQASSQTGFLDKPFF